MAGENTSGLIWDSRVMDPPLSEREKALREQFVAEYMKDFDAYQACLRVGFQSAFALEYAKRLINESYVQQRIAELTRTSPENETLEAAQDKALIKSVLRQASQNGPYASRVTAARALAAIYGLESDKGSGADGDQALIDALREFAARAPV